MAIRCAPARPCGKSPITCSGGGVLSADHRAHRQEAHWSAGDSHKPDGSIIPRLPDGSKVMSQARWVAHVLLARYRANEANDGALDGVTSVRR